MERTAVGSSVAASDRALVRDARLGDRAAFDTLVHRYGPDMYRFAVRMLGDETDAAEAVQEAFVSAWRALDSFQGRSSLRTWLFRLVARRAVDQVRRRRPTPVPDHVLEARTAVVPDPVQEVLDAELRRAVQQALATLPTTQRAVWLLREVEGLSYAEIGAALGLTTSAVRGQLARGRSALAERLETWR